MNFKEPLKIDTTMDSHASYGPQWSTSSPDEQTWEEPWHAKPIQKSPTVFAQFFNYRRVQFNSREDARER